MKLPLACIMALALSVMLQTASANDADPFAYDETVRAAKSFTDASDILRQNGVLLVKQPNSVWIAYGSNGYVNTGGDGAAEALRSLQDVLGADAPDIRYEQAGERSCAIIGITEQPDGAWMAASIVDAPLDMAGMPDPGVVSTKNRMWPPCCCQISPEPHL